MAVEPFTINQIGHEIIQTRRIWRQGSNCSVKPRTSCRIDKGTVLHDLWTHCFDLVATYQHGYCRDCIFIALFLILFFDSVVFFRILYLLSPLFRFLFPTGFRYLPFSFFLFSVVFSSANYFLLVFESIWCFEASCFMYSDSAANWKYLFFPIFTLKIFGCIIFRSQRVLL